MTKWINEAGAEYNGRELTVGGRRYVSPTAATLTALGYRAQESAPSAESAEVTEARSEISRLKELLSESDYKALKYAEGWYGEGEYAPIKAERQALRDSINELEQFIIDNS